MKITIDTVAKQVAVDEDGQVRNVPLYSADSFALLSRLWNTVGWDQKYPYGFTWFGRPIIQLPEDLVRIQEHDLPLHLDADSL